MLVAVRDPVRAAVAATRGSAALRAATEPPRAGRGVGMVAAYLLVLAALERAEAAPVAALRETSVVMAAAGAAIAGRESVPARRIAGAVLVVAAWRDRAGLRLAGELGPRSRARTASGRPRGRA